MSTTNIVQNAISDYCIITRRCEAHVHDIPSVPTCTVLCDLVGKYLDKYDELPYFELSHFCTFIMCPPEDKKKEYCAACLIRNPLAILPILKRIASVQSLPFQLIGHIVANPKFDDSLSDLITFPHDVDCNFLGHIVLYREITAENSDYERHFLESIIEKCEMNELKIEILLRSNAPWIEDIIISVLEKWDGSMDRVLQTAIEKLTKYANVISYLVNQRQVPIKKVHISSLIKRGEPNDLMILHNSVRFVPTADHMKAIISGYTDPHETMEWVNALYYCGYKPTTEDVIFGIGYRKTLPGIDRFGIEATSEIIRECEQKGFWPDYPFEDKEWNLSQLRYLCKTMGVSTIREFIEKKKVIPDHKCMENACNVKNNTSVYNYLRSVGTPVSRKALENCSYCIRGPFGKKVMWDCIKSLEEQLAQKDRLLKQMGADPEQQEENSLGINDSALVVCKTMKKHRVNHLMKTYFEITRQSNFNTIAAKVRKTIDENQYVNDNGEICLPSELCDDLGVANQFHESQLEHFVCKLVSY